MKHIISSGARMNFVWIILYLKNVRGSAHERLFLSPAETGPSGIPNPTPAQDLVEGKPGKV
jgi:hypothetical protein